AVDRGIIQDNILYHGTVLVEVGGVDVELRRTVERLNEAIDDVFGLCAPATVVDHIDRCSGTHDWATVVRDGEIAGRSLRLLTIGTQHAKIRRKALGRRHAAKTHKSSKDLENLLHQL